MREIKFKAKTESGEWVYGDLYNKIFIIQHHEKLKHLEDLVNHMKIIDPETVCQYTGLTDKNGVEIYEGDIIEHKPYGNIKTICYIDGGFAWNATETKICQDNLTFFEVIGNIYDKS